METAPSYPAQVFRDSIVAFGLITAVSLFSILFGLASESRIKKGVLSNGGIVARKPMNEWGFSNRLVDVTKLL